MKNRHAIVTGASSGIGFEISKILAKKGYDLLLISERENALLKCQLELEAEYKGSVDVLCLDLSVDGSAQVVYNYAQEKDFDTEVLVNNAGFFFFSEVVETDSEKASAMLHLHIITGAILCTLFGKEMKAKKKGYILNTSSISAFKDFPGIAYYGSSKSFIKSFTRSLRTELKRHGVHVTCLLPGATATNLYNPNVVNVPRAKKWGVMLDAEFVARKGVNALFRNRSRSIPGLTTKIMNAFSIMTPHWLIYAISKRVKYFD